MFSCFTKVFQTHNIVVDPEFQAALHESTKLAKEQQKMIVAFIDKIGSLKENLNGLKTEMEELRKENAEMREKMVDLSSKISTVIVEVFEEIESETKKQGSPLPSPPSPLTLLGLPQEPLVNIHKVSAEKPIEIIKVKEEVAAAPVEEVSHKEDYQEIPQEVTEEELETSPEPVQEMVEPEPVTTKKGRGGGRSKKK